MGWVSSCSVGDGVKGLIKNETVPLHRRRLLADLFGGYPVWLLININ